MICLIVPNSKTVFLSLWKYKGIDPDTKRPIWSLVQKAIPYEEQDTRFREAVRLSQEGHYSFYPDTREVSGKWTISPLNASRIVIPVGLIESCLNDPPIYPTGDSSAIDFRDFWRKYRSQEKIDPKVKVAQLKHELKTNPEKFPAWLQDRQNMRDFMEQRRKEILAAKAKKR